MKSNYTVWFGSSIDLPALNCKDYLLFRDSLGWLVKFIVKFLQFQPEVQQKFSRSSLKFFKELLLNFELELKKLYDLLLEHFCMVDRAQME